MKRIPLSERFSRVKAVTVDSTESETDFSDNDLFPRSSSNMFNYSNTASLSFTGNTVHKTVEEDLEHEDSDEEMFDMKTGWMEHFQKVLLKSRNLSGEHEVNVSLCDKVPLIDNTLPLQCLKNSLDQYNKLSQGSDDISEDLTTDDLTIERNETGFDMCEDNGIDEIASENVANLVVENEVEQKENVNADVGNNDSHTDKTEIPLITEPVQTSVINSETDINKTEVVSGPVPVDVLSVDTNADEDEVGTESVQIAIKLEPELEDVGDFKAADELETLNIKEHVSKTENEAVIMEEEMETRVQTIEDCEEIPVKSNIPIEDTAEKTNVLESSNALPLNVKDNENNLSNQLLVDTKHIEKRKSKETIQSELSMLSEQLGSETVRTAIIHEKNITKELNEVSTNNLNETKANEKKKDVSVQLPDSSPPKQDKEKAQNKKSVMQSDTRLKHASQKSNKEKAKNSSVSQSKKDVTKVKTFEIKPTFSFPLDELLPPVATKKGKVNEDIKTTIESATVARKRHTSETNETMQITVPEEDITCPVTPQPFIEGDIFHGTVYDSSPKNNLSETLQYQQSNFEDVDRIPLQSGSGIDTFENEFDTGMANLIAALQNGNQQVISMFQDALHDQIGSNLEALAFKAKQGQQFDPDSDSNAPSSFGFYTERKDSVGKDPDETGDNLTNEKYDELLDLFVEQCSALVKTDEDSCKLKSLMKVLQKEGEMKLNSPGFTPLPEIEKKKTHDDIPDLLNRGTGTVPSGLESFQVDSNLLDKHEVELFEGRTLLKGGVEPRHIPKTTVRKSGQDLPKDPRACLIGERSNSLVKVPLPNFAVELYGENRVKKILHLDWETEFSINRNKLAMLSERDPRTNKVSPINSELKLIVDATKTLVETLHSSIGNKTKQVDKIPVMTDQKLSSEITQSKSTENVKTKTIPVLITPQKEMVTTKALASSKERNSVLRCIDLKNIVANDSDKQEKKLCIGVVKPLIEKSKPKDVKPSVGIVKPIQLKTPLVKPETKWKGNTFTPAVSSRQSFNVEQDFDIEDGEIQVDKDTQVVEKLKDKISLSEEHHQIVSMAQNSDPEEGEIRIDEARLVDKKGKTGTKSKHHVTKCHINNKGEVESKSGNSDNKIVAQHLLEHLSNTNKVNISLSDVSSYEDGQVDTDLDKSFKEEVPVVIKDRVRSRNKDGSARHYRRRDRSSSRSSVDSRLSHTSKTRYCEEERKYYTQESTGRGNSREKSKRRDRSRSRDRNRLRNPSEEKSSSKYKHRHRHHTNKDDRSNRDNSVRSETVKRHLSVGDEKRKRHKTDEDSQLVKSDGNKYSGDIYSKPATSHRVTSVYGETDGNKLSTQMSNLPQTNSILYPNSGAENLSDAEISKEYHEKFGKYRREHPSASQTDRLTFSNNTSNSLTGKEYSYLTASKSRRKSWEDQQRQNLEDKKFLEKCKQKFLGKSSTVFNQSSKYNYSKQSESTISKPKPTSCASTYKETHCLEDGEI